MLLLLRDRVAVIPLKDPPKTGSLWTPDQAKWRPDQGIVKYRGHDVTEVKIGDHVIFSGYTGTKLVIDGEGELVIMQEEDIEVVLVDDPHKFYTAEQILAAGGTQELLDNLDQNWMKSLESKKRYLDKEVKPTEPEAPE